MSSNPPIIKFSPFEALLIGEKNKILKRQPMKNAIFVRRINRQPKTINLRDLFGLDKDKKTSKHHSKIPPRVQLKKKSNKDTKGSGSNKKDIICYEFEGKKFTEAVKSNRKKERYRSDFKRKRRKKINAKEKAVRKYAKPTRNNYIKSKALLKRKYKSRTSPRKKCIAKVMMYVNEEDNDDDNDEDDDYDDDDYDVVLDSVKFGSGSDYDSPIFIDFDDDKNLLDIVYENFPSIVKFECELCSGNFSKALIKAGLVKEENVPRPVSNGLLKNELLEILSSPFPLVRCQRVNNIKPNQCIIIKRCDIDGDYMKKSHMLKSKSLGSFFLNSNEGKIYVDGIK